MNIILQPIGFFGLLFAMFGISLIVIRSGSRQEKQKIQDLNTAISHNQELEKTQKAMQDEITKLKSDLALKNQMVDGLKGQLDELEKDYANLAEKAENSARNKPSGNMDNSAQKSDQSTTESGSPLIKII